MARRLSSKDKLKSLITVTATGATMFAGICLYQGNENFYNGIAVPLIQLLDPETAHTATVKLLKWGLLPKQQTEDPASLNVDVWGLRFTNPVGMAAGFDKQGEAVDSLHKLGFSFVEIGNQNISLLIHDDTLPTLRYSIYRFRYSQTSAWQSKTKSLSPTGGQRSG